MFFVISILVIVIWYKLKLVLKFKSGLGSEVFLKFILLELIIVVVILIIIFGFMSIVGFER